MPAKKQAETLQEAIEQAPSLEKQMRAIDSGRGGIMVDLSDGHSAIILGYSSGGEMVAQRLDQLQTNRPPDLFLDTYAGLAARITSWTRDEPVSRAALDRLPTSDAAALMIAARRADAGVLADPTEAAA